MTDDSGEAGKEWFGRRMVEELPDEAREKLRASTGKTEQNDGESDT